MHTLLFNTTCPPNHQHNGCMAVFALGQMYVRLHVAGIQNVLDISRKTKSNMTQTKITLILSRYQFWFT